MRRIGIEKINIYPAALLVVDGERRADATAGVLVDLRVDHHDEPLDELARLLNASDAFDHFFRAADAIATDPELLRREIDAAHTLLPDDENILFTRAGAFFLNGQIAEGRAAMQELFARRSSWKTVVRSFAAKGLFAIPPGVDPEELFGL